MEIQLNSKILSLIHKGVEIRCPYSVDIGEEVDIERISNHNVIIYPGTRLYGPETYIGEGAIIGHEGPATIHNCQIGPHVKLSSGTFTQAIFLSHAVVGPGAHIREGTIFEEYASAAHTVGLKQTILFPYVTLGSLINFCDCLMSGGTGAKNHSEVGSSYIHFNFTPNQDKATPSLFGDVPQGVMLNQQPIFLGGQGGIVGPCCITFNTVIAAGSLYRKDEFKPGRLLFGKDLSGGSVPLEPQIYKTVKRIVINNITYISNLIALMRWYDLVRRQFIGGDYFSEELFMGLKSKLTMAIDERIKRFSEFCEKMPCSVQLLQEILKESEPSLLIQQKTMLFERKTELVNTLNHLRTLDTHERDRDCFIAFIQKGINRYGKDYLAVIKGLSNNETQIGTTWLQTIVDTVMMRIFDIIPLCKP
ncbi:MAG: protein GlmU [Desulfobacterales bacterium]|nr:protein GlmU [Desulfobacterales bacterium]